MYYKEWGLLRSTLCTTQSERTIDVKMKELLTGIDRLSVSMKMASKWRLVIFQMDHQEYEQLYEYLTKGTLVP